MPECDEKLETGVSWEQSTTLFWPCRFIGFVFINLKE
jgi:hypothetical protein